MTTALMEQLESEIHDVETVALINKPISLDRIEERIQALSMTSPMQDVLTHRFTPGMYIREIFMPKYTLVTSKVHRTEHPYVISLGRVSVWTEEKGVVHLQAPHTGITYPGTRRLIYVHEDTIWTTFHATDKKTVEEVEADIIEPHFNPFLLNDEQMKELTQ